eukprot:566847-Prorocentrum_minimum.AAC.4
MENRIERANERKFQSLIPRATLSATLSSYFSKINPRPRFTQVLKTQSTTTVFCPTDAAHVPLHVPLLVRTRHLGWGVHT